MFIEFDEKLIAVRSINTIAKIESFGNFQIVLTNNNGDSIQESYQDEEARDDRYNDMKDELT